MAMKRGVLLTAFGGPDCLDAVEPFMCSLMGREPSPEVVAAAKRRYLAIGGRSPLPAIAERIAAQLERELSGLPRATDAEADESSLMTEATTMRAPDDQVVIPVAVGMCYSEPSVARAAAVLAARGVREVVWLSLSPFESAVTTGAYRAAVDEALEGTGIRVVEAAHYSLSEPFVSALSDALIEQLHEIDILQNKTLVVFSAHSLPVADVEADPSYVQQLQATAARVADRAGLGAPSGFEALPGIEAWGGPGVTSPWLLAFQSRGRSPVPWLDPDLDAVIDAAIEAEYRAVIVCPVGFATDHLETLWDLDIQAADRVLSAGLEFARSAVPNDDPRMIAALAGAVRAII